MTATGTLAEPAGALDVLLEALERGNVRGVRRRLCRDACFLTQDRTPILGRERVGSLLGQLVTAGLAVSAVGPYCLELGQMALVSARLQIRLPTGPEPLEQTTDGLFALVHREGEWKLLLAAPWGLP